MPLLRSFPRLLLAAIVGLAPFEALAQLSVDEVRIGVEHRSQGNVLEGWFFLVDLVGAGITSARIEKPGGGLADLEVPEGGVEAFFEDGPFESLVSLHQTYAKGSYKLTVNDAHTAPLGWNPPVLTTGSADPPVLTNRTPVHESTITETTPGFSYTTNCTSCSFSEVCILNTSGTPDAIDACADSDEPPLPTAFAFSELTNVGTAGPIMRLPGLDYELESFQSESQSTSDHKLTGVLSTFVFVRDSAVLDQSAFTVLPEPGALAAQLAAMTAAMLLARRHRSVRLRRSRGPVRGTRHPRAIDPANSVRV